MRIVLTGYSTGIGRALAEKFVAEGHHVWGLARTPLPMPNEVKGSFIGSACDVSKWDQVEKLAGRVTAVWPHVDCLITCAGVQGEVGRTLAANPSNWGDTVRVNLDGTFHAVRAFANLLACAPRRAKIICFSGGGATKSRPNFSAYASAKTGVVRLVETIAEEERGQRLDINAVAPGSVNTRLTDEVIAKGAAIVGDAEYNLAIQQKASGGTSMDRVIALVGWLISPESDGISGKLLSAVWDPWSQLERFKEDLRQSDIYTLRRILPVERGRDFSSPP